MESEKHFNELKIASCTGWGIIVNMDTFNTDTRIDILEMIAFLQNESFNWILFEIGDVIYLESATESCLDNLEVVETDTARKVITLQVSTN